MGGLAGSLQGRGEDVREMDVGAPEVAGQALGLLEAMVGQFRVFAACAARVSVDVDGGARQCVVTRLVQGCPQSRRGG